MRLVIFLFSSMFVCQVFAQDAVDSLGCLKCGHNHRSPYDFSFKHELPFILTGVGLVISSEVIKTTNSTKPFNLEELNNLDRNNVNPFDRPTTYKYKPDAAKLSDVFRTGVVIFPILFLANHHTRKDIKGLALLTTEVVVINWGLTNGVKNLVNRTRPYVYNEEVPVDVRTDSQSRLSFFSGHASHTASVSFLFAKVINDYHPEMELTKKICLWGVAATIPAVTAYLRVQSGKHFPTDVMFGYGIGATIGWLVPHLHKVKLPLSVASYSFQDANGISFTYRF